MVYRIRLTDVEALPLQEKRKKDIEALQLSNLISTMN